jgi:hypothetical protein
MAGERAKGAALPVFAPLLLFRQLPSNKKMGLSPGEMADTGAEAARQVRCSAVCVFVSYLNFGGLSLLLCPGGLRDPWHVSSWLLQAHTVAFPLIIARPGSLLGRPQPPPPELSVGKAGGIFSLFPCANMAVFPGAARIGFLCRSLQTSPVPAALFFYR